MSRHPPIIWDAAAKAKLEQLIRERKSGPQIGAAFGISEQAAKSARRKFFPELSKETPSGWFWLPAEDTTLRELWAQGLTVQEIAGRMGTGAKRVGQRVKKLKIERAERHSVENARLARQPVRLTCRAVWRGQVSDGCQYIFGDTTEPGWRYCGEPRSDVMSPWCCEHQRRVFVIGAPVNRSAAFNRAGEAR